MGFANPIGLLALAFFAVLVWIYFRDRHQATLDVPHLLLWGAVRDEVSGQRFRIDWMFILQTALLLLLAFGLARPFLKQVDETASLRRAVFLFDTSASMQTVESDRRRFDLALDRARELLDELEPATEVAVVTIGMQPLVRVPFTRDLATVRRGLESIEVGEGPSRLALGVQFVRGLQGRGTGTVGMFVFTDLPRSELSASLAASGRLHYVRVGQSDDNVAVAALRVYQKPFQDVAEAQAFALVRNYSRSPKSVKLNVSLKGKVVLESHLELNPREARAVSIRDLRTSGRLEAWIDGSDAFEVDDRALAYVSPPRLVRLLLVGGHGALASDLRRLAEVVPMLVLKEASPDMLTSGVTEFDKIDVAIFHDTAPVRPLSVNALFVHPPPGNEFFPVEGDVRDAQILDWSERHPLLRDLRYVDAIEVGDVRQLQAQKWASTVIASRAGGKEFPLALAGELDGHRVSAFAFNLADHSIQENDNLSLLLLLLNAIRWLAPPDSSHPFQVDVGQAYRESLVRPVSVVVDPPAGDQFRLSANEEVAVNIDRRGEYHIEIGDSQRTVFANLFDPRESDVGRSGEVLEELVEEGAAGVTVGSVNWVWDLAPWFYLLGLTLLVTEWLIGVRPRSIRAT